MSGSATRFARFAWATLAVNVGVVLWGAFVRATGSGAGCGSEWPTCGGELVPRSPAVETLIELTHRATSGIALVLVGILVFQAHRRWPRGHAVRRQATVAGLLMLLEAGLGASLVLLRLVGTDASLARAVMMPVHLVVTFGLLAALALAARAAGGAPPVAPGRRPGPALLVGGALLGSLLVGASGALAALGDTLFPARSLAEGLVADLSPTAHGLVRLRLVHPVLAVVVGGYVLALALVLGAAPARPAARRPAAAVVALVVAQIVAGVANVLLLAPVAMQLVHLLLADLLWIALVLLGAALLAEEPAVEAPAGAVAVAGAGAGAVAR